MGAKRDSLEMRAQIIMNMYGDYATDDERAVLQGCIDGAGSLLTMGEVDAKSTELDELRAALEDAKREALEAAAEAEAAEAAQASYYNAGYTPSYASAASYANGSGLRVSITTTGAARPITAAMCFITIARANGLRILRASGAIPTAITLLPRAIWPRARPLRAPRVIARSMTPAALPEPPITTPVGNFSASRIFGGRASLPNFRAT